MRALLVLEDGKTFPCKSFTGSGEIGGEIVFNTSMTGYQEILTDPAYFSQIVIMTYPMIGSYGINFNDIESNTIYPSSLLVKEYQPYPSNFRSKITLAEYLKSYKILGIERLDTRALTKHIRKNGSMRAFISTYDLNHESLLIKAKTIPKTTDLEMVDKVTTPQSYRWNNNVIELISNTSLLDPNTWKFRDKKFSIVVVDYGLKFSILRYLILHDCEIVVVPATTTADAIEMMNPDGVLLSSGPGDPLCVPYAVKNVQKLMLKKLPIFGVCLGHQILGLALGAKTYKLKFGHRGGNQPVKNLITGKIEITAQNHGFAIDIESMVNCDAEITHINLNDNTIEGIRHKKLPIFSVQFHPEASPGPIDSAYLFKQFKSIIKNI